MGEWGEGVDMGELERWVGHFLKCDHDVVELANFKTLIRVEF